MNIALWLLAGFATAASALHVLSHLMAAWRVLGPTPTSPRSVLPVTLVRTVREASDLERDTIRTSFTLTHPDHELIFCAAAEGDPAVAIVRDEIRRHPPIRARLLIGEHRISANPKLNNMIKAWTATDRQWIVFADSNILLPPDYLERVLATWRSDTGAVCAPPVGGQPDGFWAEVECAFLNTYQARWQYAADVAGLGFAQGKTMLFRRDILDRSGGISALASDLAEDAAATKLIRSLGLRVRLVAPPFEQPLGQRRMSQVLARQTRWAQLRRMTFPRYYLPEIATGSLLPAIAVFLAAPAFGIPAAFATMSFVAFWLSIEMAFAVAVRWHCTWRSPIACLVRDLLIPYIWVRGLMQSSYAWGASRVAARGGTVVMAAEETATV